MNPNTRDAILDAAEALLGRLGYRKMTAEEIARRAGVSRASFYLYFPTKEEAVLATVDRTADRVCDRLEEIAASDRSVPARIREMLVARVMLRFDSARDDSQGPDDLLASIRSALLARRTRHFARESRIFRRVLEEGVRSGVLTRDSVPRTARALLLATNSLLPESLGTREPGSRRTVEREARDIAELLVEGIVKRKRPAR
ncbi:MAG TPA: helix-turn-helix domain-containing protein [Thermoanaerobaculia bacterium]|nr:helix-turn-helix domain-containing protein [Thermoanaerobaculia bacterium]